MVKAIGGGWYTTQGGQNVRGKANAAALEAEETMTPDPAAPITARPSGRPTPRELAIADSGTDPSHRGLAHSVVRGQSATGPVAYCIREGCDYRRRRW